MKTKGRVNRRSDRIPRFADRRIARVSARISSREIKRGDGGRATGDDDKTRYRAAESLQWHGSRRAEYQRESDGLKAARDPHLSPGLSRAQVKGKRERASERASERHVARHHGVATPRCRSASLRSACRLIDTRARATRENSSERASERVRERGSERAEGCLGVILSRVFSGGGERARQRDRGKSRLAARGREGKRQGGGPRERAPGSACAPN